MADLDETSLSKKQILSCRNRYEAEKNSRKNRDNNSYDGNAVGELRLHVLASGSRGNAAIIENALTGEGILFDCGICKRDFFTRCDEAGFDPAKLSAILLTHDHTDHTKGLGGVLRGLAKQGIEPSVYAERAVCAASKEIHEVRDACDMQEFSFGAALALSNMMVHVFRTSHDAASSCGFRIEGAQGDRVGFMTDTGVVTPEAHEALGGVRILALESNHDVQMLKDGPYPYPIKRRVSSDFGHLSNVQAAEELELLLSNSLEQVVAMHVSQNNNTYRLPAEGFSAVIEQAAHQARVRVAYQG